MGDIENQLRLAVRDDSLPVCDLHGMTRVAVKPEVDALLHQFPGIIVRIMTGRGEGILEGELEAYLKQLERRSPSPIRGFRQDINTHSFVVFVSGSRT